MTSKKQATNPTPVNPDRTDWIFLILFLAVVLYTRLALLGMPLERDEGGYAYIGERLFGTQHLYSDMLDIKLPGLYFLYWLFNQLPGGYEKSIHLGLLLMHAGALWVFFMWVRRAFNLSVGVVATVLFAISAVMPGVYGFAAHATQLIQLPVMGALYLLWGYIQDEQHRRPIRLVAAGLCLGFAFTVKQPAIVFIFFAIGALLWMPGSIFQRLWRPFILGSATLVPFGGIVAYFYLQGRFDDFWMWTFTMPTAQTISGSDTWQYLSDLVPMMIGNHWLFWGLGVLSLAVVPFTGFSGKSKAWAVSLLVLAIVSAAIGLGFMPHYFIPSIPWAALGIAAGLHWATRGNKTLYFGAAAVLAALPILMNSSYFLQPNYAKIMEQCYHWNGFAEAKAVSLELKKRLKPGERVAVFGSEPQINYYTGTEHCSPHLFMYPVVRETKYKNQFQQQFLSDINACNAEYVVLTASEASWIPGFTETPLFKRQLFPKLTEGYDLIGRANIGQTPLNIVWDEALKNHNPPQCPPMFVFRKKQH
ncbi:MAG: glycosyltransferase family 39 protein [Saprospiraceae bacterium]|nr:glycosyltransferase family 39 protein [Saprospiraceae bacterium]